MNVWVPEVDLERAAKIAAQAEGAVGADLPDNWEAEATVQSATSPEEKLPWGQYDLDEYGVKASDLADDDGVPRSHSRRLKGWVLIAILAGPAVVAILASIFQRIG
ncbi:MAG: hypothetical protein ACKVPX_14385 [Myxococcaceae bacterium]